MKLTIKTTYQGPTDTRGSRILAKGGGRQLTQPYDYSVSTSQAHEQAASALARLIFDQDIATPGDVESTEKGYVFSFYYRLAVVAP